MGYVSEPWKLCSYTLVHWFNLLGLILSNFSGTISTAQSLDLGQAPGGKAHYFSSDFFPLPRGIFFPDHPFTMKPAGKQASKPGRQAGQASKQAKQASQQASKPGKEASKQLSNRARQQASKQAGTQASQASRPSQPSQPTSKQACKPASKGATSQLASKQASHAGKPEQATTLHAGKQAGKAASKHLRKQARK